MLKENSKIKRTLRHKKNQNNDESLSQSVFMTHYNTVLFDPCGKIHHGSGDFIL